MKLELKHLAPYLPYGLNVWHTQNKKVYPLVVGNSTMSIRGGLRIDEIEDNKCIPILRQLSDLTITFAEDEIINGDIILSENDIFEIQNNSIGHLMYYQVTYLLMHNFDIFGLIKAGLAIDINTL